MLIIPLGAIIGFVLARIVTKKLGMILAVPLWLFMTASKHVLPKTFLRWLTHIANRRQKPIVMALIFLALFAVLLLFFRDLIGVLGGLLAVAALLGIPTVLNKAEQWVWRVISRHKTKGGPDEPSTSPNGSPTTPTVNSGVTEKPPLVR